MKKQNVLHTERVNSNGKVYFLDLKEAENGNNYLVITQSKMREDDKYERIKMILFESEIEQFATAFSRIIFKFNPSEKQNGGKFNEEYVEKIRKEHPNAFQPWTKEDEELLTALFNDGKTVIELSKSFQRNEGGIKARLAKLGLEITEVAA
jgi:catalase (peroxidase I)